MKLSVQITMQQATPIYSAWLDGWLRNGYILLLAYHFLGTKQSGALVMMIQLHRTLNMISKVPSNSHIYALLSNSNLVSCAFHQFLQCTKFLLPVGRVGASPASFTTSMILNNCCVHVATYNVHCTFSYVYGEI